MTLIRRLSVEVIDQIAAGEVVEQPSSVIKELVENALDAKANQIIIRVKEGGFGEITIEDDGEGIAQKELQLSLLRHATSKIRESQDLFHLQTMGFRGEALASIAAISFLEIRSSQGEEGGFVKTEGGKVVQEGICAKKKGTTVQVSSLFYNVPARKAFQKSVGASNAEILRCVSALCLSQYEKHFELYKEEKKILFCPRLGKKTPKEFLSSRLRALGKEELVSKGTWVSFEEKGFSLHGFLGSAEMAKKNRLGQFLFLNKRWVVSPQISSILKEVYATRIAESLFPSFVLFLDLPPEKIDVNVHPQKKEVRLQNFFEIKNFFFRALSFFYEPLVRRDKVSFTPSFFKEEAPAFSTFSPPFIEEKKQEESPFLFSTVRFLHLEKTFFFYVEEAQKKLLLVDLKKLYEELFFHSLKREQSPGQKLMVPLSLDFSPYEVKVLIQETSFLQSHGIEIRPLSDTTIAVDMVPEFLSQEEVFFFFSSFVEIFAKEENRSFFSKKIRQWSHKVSARKKSFTWEEAKALYELGKKHQILASCEVLLEEAKLKMLF